MYHLKSPALLLVAALLSSCAFSHHPEVVATAPAPQSPAVDWDAVLAGPGIIELESVASARWEASLAGMVNLDHPEAVAAGLKDQPTPIVLPVHVLRHPTAGVFVVDSGVSRDLAAGGSGGIHGPIKSFLKGMTPVEPLGDLIARQDAPLAGVLLTHLHLDHILGLPDVPAEVPVYAGPGEQSEKKAVNGLLRRTYGDLMDGLGPLHTWDFDHAPAADPFPAAIDILGDGSLWALSTPGHTPGSTAYLALTTAGPVLFTGDACHTWWGWNHGVEPGTFTADAPTGIESLAHLKALVAAHPQIRVFPGHELDGEGTGVAALKAQGE